MTEDAVPTSVAEHYERHLRPVYGWMIGDVAAALERSHAYLRGLGLPPGAGRIAVDLGAGPGLYAVPLAERGFSVVAVDQCAALLSDLRERAESHGVAEAIRTIAGDLRDFWRYLERPADVVVCLGDTLTHLPSRAAVDALIKDVATALVPGGCFATTFRDYAGHELAGTARFIPVRSDAHRILVCMLEYEGELVRVHDVLHERRGDGWELRVSAYPKVRLAPAWVAERLAAHGLQIVDQGAEAGMTSLVARRV